LPRFAWSLTEPPTGMLAAESVVPTETVLGVTDSGSQLLVAAALPPSPE
jgi:hypothetical protein